MTRKTSSIESMTLALRLHVVHDGKDETTCDTPQIRAIKTSSNDQHHGRDRDRQITGIESIVTGR